MNTRKTAVLVAALFAGSLTITSSAIAIQAPPAVGVDEALRADKMKTIARRDARAQDAVAKVQAKIAQWKSDPATAPYAQRMEAELMSIQMFGSGETDSRLKDDVDLLATAGSVTSKPPTADELAPLQARYAKLAADLDDRILVKDFDRLVKKHDRFIRYTSLGLWDKNKIAEELQSMEEMAASAPDIAFGRAETLRGLQDRRLAAVPKLVYVGTQPHEEFALSPNRRSVGIVEETLAGQPKVEHATLMVQNSDGKWTDITTPNNPALGMPFAPPLSLWMKSRMAEGRVPAITFELPPNMTAQDVLDGKLDDYFKRNMTEIANTKQAALVGIFDNFDQQLAANSFGDDGRTPFYMFDPKIDKANANADFVKKSLKGAYANPKAMWPDLSSHYGDKAIPDGPERVRDAWKHVREAIGKTGPNIAYFSSAGSFHGSKYPTKANDEKLAWSGNEAWNKLDYYYPGEGVLDWLGVEAIGTDPTTDPKGPNLTEAIDQFFFEVRSSNWQNTPVALTGLSPAAGGNPAIESEWIPLVFQRVIPGTYPNVSIVFIDLPHNLTLWTREASSAFRTNVTSNKQYQWPLRFKMLTP